MSSNPIKASRRIQLAATAQPVDPYSADDGYDPNKVVSSLGDKQSIVKARIPVDEDGRIAKIVEQRIVPEYQTKSHFIRDAIWHRLHHVEQMHPDPALHRVLNTSAYLSDSQRRLDRMEAEQKVVVTSKQVMQQALAHRDRGVFDEELAAAEEAIDGMIGQYREDMRTLVAAMRVEAGKVKW